MVQALGCIPAGRDIRLSPGTEYAATAKRLFAECGLEWNRPLIGVAPGAAYGPAKKWFPARFAAVTDRLIDATGAQAVLFGSDGDRESTAAMAKYARNRLIDVAGKTTLMEAMALIARCALFLSNDSGLMHVAGAMGVPTIAIFGSTNPAATSPAGEKSVVIHHDVPCGPCLKPVCPTDFSCMEMIGVEEVYAAARKLLGYFP
jgi:heptosyltransferase II